MADLCEIDTKLARAVILRLPDRGLDVVELVGGDGGGNGSTFVEFQFPPRITSDGRAVEWSEVNPTGGKEQATTNKLKERRLTLEWTYIVGMAGWSSEKVKKNVALTRTYFDAAFIANIWLDMAIKLKLWLLGGSQEMSFRATSVETTYGKAIIVPNGDVDRAYALRTDMRLNLISWTGGLDAQTIGDVAAKTLPGWY